MPKNMVNPSNGKVIVVDDAKVGIYAKLGYREESSDEAVKRHGAEVEREYYEDQGFQAGLEGAISGATLGLSDMVFGNEGTAKRAAYNPGARMVGELVGAIGGAKVPFLPAAKAAKVGERVGAAVGAKAGQTAGRAVGLGVEGAIQGAGASAAYTSLSGDPLTAESLVSGAGLGFMLGAGMGALGSKLSTTSTKLATDAAESKGVLKRLDEIDTELVTRKAARAEERAAEANARAAQVETGTPAPYEAVIPEHRYSATRASLEEAADDLASASDQVDETMGAVTDENYFKAAQSETQKVTRFYSRLGKGNQETFSKEMQRLSSAIKSLERDRSNVGRILAHEAALKEVADAIGVQVTLPTSYSAAAQKVLKDAHRAAEVADLLSEMPKSLKGFAELSEAQVRTLSDAVEEAGKFGNQVGPRAKAAAGAVDTLVKDAGFAGSEPLADRMLAFRNALRKSSPEALEARASAVKSTKAAEEAALKLERWALRQKAPSNRDVSSFFETAAGYGGGVMAARYGRAIGGTWGAVAGFGLGRMAVRGLMGVKAGVLNSFRGAIAKFGRPVGKGLHVAAPVSPWALFEVSLTGQDEDAIPKDGVRAAMVRMEEVAQLAPHVEDVALSAVAPFRGDHPDLAAQMAKGISTAVKYLQEVMPRDPGTVVMRGVSVWKPSPVQARDFGERYHTVVNPFKALGQYLQGQLSPVAVHAFANGWPSLYDFARGELLRQLPATLPEMTKAQRTQASWLLGVGLDGSQAPSFVRFLQQNLASAPLQGPGPVPAPGAKAGGRPSGPDESTLTAAERITENF